MTSQSTDRVMLERALENCTQDPDTWTVLYRDEALAMAAEIHQLRRDLAIQAVNAKMVTDLQAEIARLQADIENLKQYTGVYSSGWRSPYARPAVDAGGKS